MVCPRNVQFKKAIRLNAQTTLGIVSLLTPGLAQGTSIETSPDTLSNAPIETLNDTPTDTINDTVVQDVLKTNTIQALDAISPEAYERLEQIHLDILREWSDHVLPDSQDPEKKAELNEAIRKALFAPTKGQVLRQHVMDAGKRLFDLSQKMAQAIGLGALFASFGGAEAGITISSMRNRAPEVNEALSQVAEAVTKVYGEANSQDLNRVRDTVTQAVKEALTTEGDFFDTYFNWLVHYPWIPPVCVAAGGAFGYIWYRVNKCGVCIPTKDIVSSKGVAGVMWTRPPPGYKTPAAVRCVYKTLGENKPEIPTAQIYMQAPSGRWQWYDLPEKQRIAVLDDKAVAGRSYRVKKNGKLKGGPWRWGLTDGKVEYNVKYFNRQSISIFHESDTDITRELMEIKYEKTLEEPVLTRPPSGYAIPTNVTIGPDGICQVMVNGVWYQANTLESPRPLFYFVDNKIVEGPAFQVIDRFVVPTASGLVSKYRVVYDKIPVMEDVVLPTANQHIVQIHAAPRGSFDMPSMDPPPPGYDESYRLHMAAPPPYPGLPEEESLVAEASV